ncbi:MAG: NAD(P)-binding domain-containing protein [Gammaproteobacteria bacterium]|nr:NAD(P)-binding domain-containing protein [Gammaproteobacteria bacterium]
MTKHLQPSTDPITEDRIYIAEALKGVNTAALIMSIVHMTGDTSILRGSIRPKLMDVVAAGAEAEGDEPFGEGGFTQEEMASVRAQALEAIESYRDRGCTLPTLDEDSVTEMFHYMSGRDLDTDYAAFVKEEIALDGVDCRGLVLDDAALQERAQNFPVIIIGAGMGGVLAAIRLDEAGIPYTVLEKNPGIGGTWYENCYPGCRVDVAGHSYSYSFEPNHDWSCHFPLADDIRAYYDHCAEEYDVKKHIRFNTEVVEAVYDEAEYSWRVRVSDQDGREEILTARAIISAVGQLNRPKMPDIQGLDSFTGEVVHSGAWRGDGALAGKRVAVIGSGASAFQIIPELAQTTVKLEVFQRSPAWMFPNPAYHSEVSEGQKWALKKLPYYSKWYRFWLFYAAVEGVYEQTLADEYWDSPLSVSASNDEMRKSLSAWIESQVADPELLQKVLPRYPPFGKRILQDNGTYLAALQHPDTEVITTGIRACVADGIITEDGSLHEVDVIVCATGFHADHFLFPMKIVGCKGIELAEQWGEDNGRAYLGITVPNFPNLFCIYGPNTNLVVAGSIAHNAESQVNYILRCFRLLFENGLEAMNCRQAIHDQYNAKVDAANAATAWGSPLVNNWYKNSAGRITANLPFRIIDYWKMTKQPNPDDFIFSGRSL